MTDPFILSANTIISIAFIEFLEPRTDKPTNQFTSTTLRGMRQLRQQILNRLNEEVPVIENTKVLADIQNSIALDQLRQLVPLLAEAMRNDPSFAFYLNQLATPLCKEESVNVTLKRSRQVITNSSSSSTQINEPSAPVFTGPIDGGTFNITYNHSITAPQLTTDDSKPAGKVFFEEGLKLFRFQNYRQAANKFRQAIETDSSLLDSYYYLSISLLSGRVPRKVDRSTIIEIEDYLKLITSIDTSSPKYYTFWAVVKYGYYSMNSLRERPPYSNHLFNKGRSISFEDAQEIIRHVEDFSNKYWQLIKEKINGTNKPILKKSKSYEASAIKRKNIEKPKIRKSKKGNHKAR